MNESQDDRPRGGGAEKIWERTRKTFQTATFEANRYKRMVQKKIDLAALHKKISAGHGDLGKQIDDLREAGEADIMNTEEVQELLRRLDGYKRAAALLEEEIEMIKSEQPSEEEPREPAAEAPSGDEPPEEEEKR